MSYWHRHPFQGFLVRAWLFAIFATIVLPIPFAPLLVMVLWVLNETVVRHR